MSKMVQITAVEQYKGEGVEVDGGGRKSMRVGSMRVCNHLPLETICFAKEKSAPSTNSVATATCWRWTVQEMDMIDVVLRFGWTRVLDVSVQQ